jgi:hypothetical protein
LIDETLRDKTLAFFIILFSRPVKGKVSRNIFKESYKTYFCFVDGVSNKGRNITLSCIGAQRDMKRFENWEGGDTVTLCCLHLLIEDRKKQNTIHRSKYRASLFFH